VRRRVLGLGWAATAVGLVVALTGAGGARAAAQAPPPPAAVPDPAAVAAGIDAAGWYADEAAAGDRAQMAVVSSRLTAAHDQIGVAFLAVEPPGSSTAYADRVLNELERGRLENGIFVTSPIETVVVLTPTDVGVASDHWDNTAIDRALDASVDDLGADRVGGLDALATALAVTPPPSPGGDGRSSAGDDSSGGAVSLVLVVAVTLGIVLVGLVVRAMREDGMGADSPSSVLDDGDDGDDRSSWTRRQRMRRLASRSSWSPSRRTPTPSRRSSSSSSSSSSSRRSSSGGGSLRGHGGRHL